MNVYELLREERIENINKLIDILRELNIADERIYQNLIKYFGDKFTKDELKKMLRESKR